MEPFDKRLTKVEFVESYATPVSKDRENSNARVSVRSMVMFNNCFEKERNIYIEHDHIANLLKLLTLHLPSLI